MTAFDTTNLRLTVTVPSHGMLFIRMQCAAEGATSFPQVLLGVLNGSTVVGRQQPMGGFTGPVPPTASTRGLYRAEFTVSNLTPGSITLDAAYGVEVVVASTNIKYGGPNDTTIDNAYGGFLFEIWDPQPLPTAANGAINGLITAPSVANQVNANIVQVAGSTVITNSVATTNWGS